MTHADSLNFFFYKSFKFFFEFSWTKTLGKAFGLGFSWLVAYINLDEMLAGGQEVWKLFEYLKLSKTLWNSLLQRELIF